ncbi:DUF2946 domain-containing protein [Pararobbsia alpina]
MRSRIFQKIGVVLGMIAILMATLAPTVSQALVAHRSHLPPGHIHCTMARGSRMGAMPGMASNEDAGAMTMHRPDASGAMMADGADMSSMSDMSGMSGMPDASDAGGMMMDPAHAMLMHAGMASDMHDAGHGGIHHMMSHGDACGYCSLLAHMPVVPVVQMPFAVTVWAIQHRVATRFERVRRAEPLTFAQARAPPVQS